MSSSTITIIAVGALGLAIYLAGVLLLAKCMSFNSMPAQQPRQIDRRCMPHLVQAVDDTLALHGLFPNGMTHDQAFARLRWLGVSEERAKALLAGERRKLVC